MDGWKINFPLGWPIFRGELLVSGRVVQPRCQAGDDSKLSTHGTGVPPNRGSWDFPQQVPRGKEVVVENKVHEGF